MDRVVFLTAPIPPQKPPSRVFQTLRPFSIVELNRGLRHFLPFSVYGLVSSAVILFAVPDALTDRIVP